MGQVIAGRFELATHIASGGSGSIWAAWDRRREMWCAAKVLRHKDSGELLRFVREQGIQLDHRHLATPYGWAAEDEDVAIAMLLVAGGTLDAALRDHGAFSSALTSALLLQLLDALDHVHAAGWIHRDVKPANILLEPTGEGAPHLRLGDFGIAVREDGPRFTSVGWVNGTPGYLAPEAMDLAAPAPAQDLYAAGVVALRMVDFTLKGERGLEAAVLDATRTLEANPSVDPLLASVVAGLVHEDPDVRLAAAEQAAGSLEAVARPQTASGGYLSAIGEPFTVFHHLPEDELLTGDGSLDDAANGPAVEPADVPGRVPAVAPDRETAVPTPATRGPWVLVAVGALALLAGAFLLWPRDDVPEPPAASPADTPATAATPAADTPATAATPAADQEAPSTPAPSPSSLAVVTEKDVLPAISSSVSSGDDCTWLERGMVVTGADSQVLTCVDGASGFQWATTP